jgi:hypothetical protein
MNLKSTFWGPQHEHFNYILCCITWHNIYVACMYNWGDELFQTMAVQQWQYVNVVGCHMVFCGPIGMFACDNLQIPSGCKALSCIPFPLQWTHALCTTMWHNFSQNYLVCTMFVIRIIWNAHMRRVWKNIKGVVTEWDTQLPPYLWHGYYPIPLRFAGCQAMWVCVRNNLWCMLCHSTGLID